MTILLTHVSSPFTTGSHFYIIRDHPVFFLIYSLLFMHGSSVTKVLKSEGSMAGTIL